MKKIIFRIFLLAACFVGLGYFCEAQTKGFRLQEILSDIPNNPAWDVEPLPAEQQREVVHKLDQKFRYLGSGNQSHAFLGEDGKTVLKFFRHNDLSLMKILNQLSAEKWLWYLTKKFDPRGVFDSCKLAYVDLQDQTAISYLHLNKTGDLFKPAVLVDNSGVSHTVELDGMEFMVQDYCELATGRIAKRMKSGDVEGAKATIQSLFAAIEDWSKRGVHIENPALKRNIGFCGDKVIMFDVGSLRKDISTMTPEQITREVKHVTRALGRWIYKKHPQLSPCFDQELAKS
ncbi:MAG TPA: hypothetical protein VIJ14_02545 [Rhabdochlamydiaceae bacterium]